MAAAYNETTTTISIIYCYDRISGQIHCMKARDNHTNVLSWLAHRFETDTTVTDNHKEDTKLSQIYWMTLDFEGFTLEMCIVEGDVFVTCSPPWQSWCERNEISSNIVGGHPCTLSCHLCICIKRNLMYSLTRRWTRRPRSKVHVLFTIYSSVKACTIQAIGMHPWIETTKLPRVKLSQKIAHTQVWPILQCMHNFM